MLIKNAIWIQLQMSDCLQFPIDIYPFYFLHQTSSLWSNEFDFKKNANFISEVYCKMLLSVKHNLYPPHYGMYINISMPLVKIRLVYAVLTRRYIVGWEPEGH